MLVARALNFPLFISLQSKLDKDLTLMLHLPRLGTCLEQVLLFPTSCLFLLRVKELNFKLFVCGCVNYHIQTAFRCCWNTITGFIWSLDNGHSIQKNSFKYLVFRSPLLTIIVQSKRLKIEK